MNALMAVLLLSGLMTVSKPASPAGDYYKLTGVKRVDQDLYKTGDGIYIQTRYCYHYTYGEEAILKWEGQYSYSNKIIWSDESTCDVKGLMKG